MKLPAASVIVLGAGLAGLGAARILTQNGYKVDVFEASPDRVGGRVESGNWIDGNGVNQKFEIGGELIDVGHGELRQLVRELGLTQTDIYKAGLGLSRIFKVQDPGHPDADANGFVDYSEDDFRADYKGKRGIRNDEDGLPNSPWWRLHKDSVAAGYPTHWDSYTARGRELANTTIDEYLDYLTKGLSTNYFKQVMQTIYTIEFGVQTYTDVAPPNEDPPRDPDTVADRRRGQSALNFVYLISYVGPGQVRLFGQGAEKFHVKEGMSAVVNLMKDEIVESGSEVHMGQRVEKITRANMKNEAGMNVPGWHIRFRDVQTEQTYTLKAERVINALPMAVMRKYHPDPAALDPAEDAYLNTQAGEPNVPNDGNGIFDWNVDVSEAQFSSRKRRAILKLAPAEVTKIMIQYHSRPWLLVDSNGDSVASNKVTPSEVEQWYQNSWDSTAGEPGTDGILTLFTAAQNSRRYGSTGPGSSGQSDENDPVGIYHQIKDLIDNRVPTAFPGSNQWPHITRPNGIITNKYFMRNWSDYENARSAWSTWNTGSEAPSLEFPDNAFAGIEGEREPIWDDSEELIPTPENERNCWFASEAVTDEYQGFMNGALVGGINAAASVITAINNAGLSPSIL